MQVRMYVDSLGLSYTTIYSRSFPSEWPLRGPPTDTRQPQHQEMVMSSGRPAYRMARKRRLLGETLKMSALIHQSLYPSSARWVRRVVQPNLSVQMSDLCYIALEDAVKREERVKLVEAKASSRPDSHLLRNTSTNDIRSVQIESMGQAPR